VPLAVILAAGCIDSKNGTPVDIRDATYSDMLFTEKMGMYFSPVSGTVTMGTPGNPGESPVHTAGVTRFFISRTEVIQRMYRAASGGHESDFPGDNRPVDSVSWYDAVRFCNRLSLLDGFERCYDEYTWECDFDKSGYRLPTEAEWELACHGGGTTLYSPGDTENDLAREAWYAANADSASHDTAQRDQNAYGLFDMHGNVAEWCNDYYGEYFPENTDNPTGPVMGTARVIRGGSWKTADPDSLRCASRLFAPPTLVSDTVGFRVVRR